MKNSNNRPISEHPARLAVVAVITLTFVFLTLYISLPFLESFLFLNIPLTHADALVVMAGETSVRLPAAAKLFKKGKADKILLTNDGIFSSWSEEKQRNLYDVEWAEEKLMKMGVPASSIVKLTYSASGSIFDALNTRNFVMANHLKSLIVVTSDYHTRRSFWTFERVFQGRNVKIGVYPADSGMEKMPVVKKGLILVYEMIKYLYYNLQYSNIK